MIPCLQGKRFTFWCYLAETIILFLAVGESKRAGWKTKETNFSCLFVPPSIFYLWKNAAAKFVPQTWNKSQENNETFQNFPIDVLFIPWINQGRKENTSTWPNEKAQELFLKAQNKLWKAGIKMKNKIHRNLDSVPIDAPLRKFPKWRRRPTINPCREFHSIY